MVANLESHPVHAYLIEFAPFALFYASRSNPIRFQVWNQPLIASFLLKAIANGSNWFTMLSGDKPPSPQIHNLNLNARINEIY